MGAGSDSDEDMRVGMKYLQQTLPAVTAPTKQPGKGSWDPPEGTMDDVIAALAVTGVPCAIVSFSPSEEDPLTQVVEWDDGVFPAPMEDNGEQLTSTISRTYAPAGPHDPDEGQRGHNPTEWINRYLDTHPKWTVILSRRGLDGRLSFATFVRRKSAPLPVSVADEERRLQVKDSQDSLQLAIISFGRSKLISVAAHSLNETRPKGICPSVPCSEERLTQAKADMLLTARTFPGKLEWNVETLVSLAVADSLEQCLEALDGEQSALGGAMDAHVALRNKLGWPADDTGTYIARTFISMQRAYAAQNDTSNTHKDGTELCDMETAASTRDGDSSERVGQDMDHGDTSDDEAGDEDDDDDGDDNDDDDDGDHDDWDDHDDDENARRGDDHNRGRGHGRRVPQPTVIDQHAEGSTSSSVALPSGEGRRRDRPAAAVDSPPPTPPPCGLRD